MSLLTLKQAEIIIDKALEEACPMKFPALAFAVLDHAGHTEAVKLENETCGAYGVEQAGLKPDIAG